jgi:hypothetical protein
MPTDNTIVAENQLPGTPMSQWQMTLPGDTSIEGFTTDISTNVGGTVSFKINTDSTNYRIEIYRLGYYGGDGARLVATIQHQSATSVVQPAPITDPTTLLVDAGNWSVTDSWQVPGDAVSGVYIARLVRQDGHSPGSGENEIPFVVRNDSSTSDIVFQTSDTTWQAYNSWGGHSLYDDTGGGFAVSYNRPITTRGGGQAAGPWDYIFGAEYPTIYWLEENGYDVSYIAGVDTARSGSLLLNHKVFMSVGHDEYWSAEQVANVQAARDAGVNLAFFSGDTAFWKTEWQPSSDASHTSYRTIVTYKSTDTGVQNPDGVWTGAWRDPAGGGPPENALVGTMYSVNNPGTSDPITITYPESQARLWRNTSVASTQPGGTASLMPDLLAYEYNEDIDNNFRPAGLIDLSSTTSAVTKKLQPDGTYAPGIATHSLTEYRAPSGALVFSAGTVFWSWGLSSMHDGGPTDANLYQWGTHPTDPNVQQATVNLLADMGVQPGTLQPGLVAGTQSTDHTPPQSSIAGISDSIASGDALVSIAVAANDLGGGVVSGVEVSTDGGSSWHPATGQPTASDPNWTYTWDPPAGIRSYSIETRAVDDSLNIEVPTQQLPVTAVGLSGYLSANPDVAASGMDPLYHYDTYGWNEGRDPAWNFDTQLYLLHNPDVAAAGADPLEHYLIYGRDEGRPIYDAVGSQAIEDGSFDPEYYLLLYTDVGKAGFDPYQHYLLYGWKEGRNPNAYFDTQFYLSSYPDAAASGMDPLTYYDTVGWKLGEDPSPKFSTLGYENANPDVVAAGFNPLTHFLMYGANEGRSPLGTTTVA